MNRHTPSTFPAAEVTAAVTRPACRRFGAATTGLIRILTHPAQWGLRVRSALIVAVVISAGLAVAALSLTYVLYRSLVTASDEAATDRIRQVTAQLALHSPADLDRSALSTDNRVAIVQIIDQTGHVVQSSTDSPTRPITDERPAPGTTTHHLPPTTRAYEGRISATTVDGRGGRYTIVVATNQEEIERTIKLVGALVASATPFIVALAALATYALVGRSLRSVERIRTRVAAITSADLTDRVPVPPQRDEIAALAETMNDMLARIEAGHNAQRRFISDASHELRSPLTTITAALELGRAEPAILDAAMLDDTVLPEAQRMRQLIDDLLLLARADENALTQRRTDVDLDDVLTAEVARTRTTTTLTIDIAVEPARISGDPNQISRAIRNLLDNATRYAATTITVRLRRDLGNARIEIADDGPGIAAPDRARIFDRFYRPQHDRGRGTGGSGLGLAIVAEIITAHYGTVRIDQNLPTGTIAIIDLPRTDA
ncbi:HAMP domain-containing sensor histidine kinase [Nocardia sp. R16R-3T]